MTWQPWHNVEVEWTADNPVNYQEWWRQAYAGGPDDEYWDDDWGDGTQEPEPRYILGLPMTITYEWARWWQTHGRDHVTR
jgi:hypothetical protein